MDYRQQSAFAVLDKLASEPTAANVKKLADFLFDPDPIISARAAWRVAKHMRLTAVVGKKRDFPPISRVGPADWAWEPFGVSEVERSLVSDIIGILVRSPDESVPNPFPVLPPEIALPALVLLGPEIRRMPFTQVLHLTLTNEQSAELEERVRKGLSKTYPADEVSRKLVTSVLNQANAPARIRAILNSLPGQAQEVITQNFKFNRLPTPDDWRALFGERKPSSKPLPTKPSPRTPLKRKAAFALIAVSIGAAIFLWFGTEHQILSIVVAIVGVTLGRSAWRVPTRIETVERNPLEGADNLIDFNKR